MARLVGQKLTESWGQQVIVDNRPGGNTIIGTDALAKSKPDGYPFKLAEKCPQPQCAMCYLVILDRKADPKTNV